MDIYEELKLDEAYMATLDSRKRVVIRGADSKYYNVKKFQNGIIMMVPQTMKTPDTISEQSLKMIYESCKNWENDEEPVDLAEVRILKKD